MFLTKVSYLLLICTTSIICGSRDGEVKTEEDLGVKYANRCEVCKILATELQSRLEETGKVHDVLEIGYSLDDVQPKKKTKYEKSELRLIESLDGVCERILEYNIHKERQDSTRFAKGMSQTFKTLHGLVDKGVKVDLGIPYELWDKPSAEITHMKTQCESLLEDNEESIEYWYWNLQGTKDLKIHLCTDHALRNTDNSCLNENLNTKGDQGEKSEDILKENDKSSLTDREVKVDPEPAIDEDDLLVPQSKRKIKENADNIYDSYVPQSKHTPSKEYTNRNSKDTGSERIANKHRYGDLSDNYWTEPSQYVQRHLKEIMAEDEPKLAQPETKDNDDKSKGLKSEKEEL